MNVQQLQLLAGRIRDLLQHSDRSIGHSQSLDLVAAVPGLRNWPEVRAFPSRVDKCDFDESAAARLAFRLRRQYALDLTPSAILAALAPASENSQLPEIWPAGPEPGVYVTTSQKAIDALLANYEEATDGALVYAERAASGGESTIELGEQGLWSPGLNRVPSGTLIVVGPIELNQSDWKEGSERLEMACSAVFLSGHRVAVLAKTESPESLFQDLVLMVRQAQQPGEELETLLAGIVTEQGALQRQVPFAPSRPSPRPRRITSSPEQIPSDALPHLQRALARRAGGLLLFGSTTEQEYWGMDLISASLPLTDHLGPIARIRPRSRSTPSKDWLVPDPIKEIPYLPSIESAYESGYRRMIISPGFTEGGLVLEYAPEVLFLAGAFGTVVDELCLETLRVNGFRKEHEILTLVIAALGVTSVRTRSGGTVVVSDLFVAPENERPSGTRFEEILKFVDERRVIKWQEKLAPLVESGEVTKEDLRQSLRYDRALSPFLNGLKHSFPK